MPRISKYETGQKFGKWTLISRDLTKKKPMKWLCRCECGHEHILFLQNVIRGLSTQCKECQAIAKSKHLIGKKFGFLKILSVEKYQGKSNLKVKCDCGKERFLKPNRIIQQGSISCGLCNLGKKKAKNIKRYFDIGSTFGWLKVLKRIDNKTVECKCKCGNIIARKLYHLQTNTPSCGCFKKKVNEKMSKDRTGERNFQAKLKNLEVSSLKLLHSTGQYNSKELSLIFDITYDCCMAILRGDTWKNIE